MKNCLPTAKEYFIKNNFDYFTNEQMNVICKTMRDYADELLKLKNKQLIIEAYEQGRLDEETRFPVAEDGEDYYKIKFSNQ